MGLHLRRALGSRVTRMTLIDPVVVNVLRDQGEEASYAEMEEQYQRFMGGLPDQTKAARVFVEHWSGKGAWESIGERARSVITSLVPKLRLEMISARCDTTGVAFSPSRRHQRRSSSGKRRWSRRWRRPGSSRRYCRPRP